MLICNFVIRKACSLSVTRTCLQGSERWSTDPLVDSLLLGLAAPIILKNAAKRNVQLKNVKSDHKILQERKAFLQ